VFLLAFLYFTDPQPAAPGVFQHCLALTGIVFGSVLVHELGHTLAAIRFGVTLRPVVLLPIGGVPVGDDLAMLHGEAAEPVGEAAREARWRREWHVAIVGPAVSLLMAGIAAAVLVGAVPGLRLAQLPLIHSSALMRSVVWVNVFLAALNLVPAYPLDAGRALRANMARRMEFLAATRRAVSLGQGLALLMMFTGLWSTWAMLGGFFLFLAAQLEERTFLFHAVLENVRMGDVMLTDFATLSPADTLEDALNKAVHTLQDDFPVIRGNDLVGVISRQHIVRALRDEGNSYVQSAMEKAYEIANRDDSLASAFRRVSARGMTLIPVVEDERLVGIVTLQNLMHSMSLLAESRRARNS
jgi:Zn-dependent protease/CBS domain-containing protein